MTFADLQSALARLADDPRIHSTTPVVLSYCVRDKLAEDEWTESAPLCCLGLDGHALALSAHAAELALAR